MSSLQLLRPTRFKIVRQGLGPDTFKDDCLIDLSMKILELDRFVSLSSDHTFLHTTL